MVKRLNSFQRDWLQKPDFSSWLVACTGNVHSAKCKLCMKTFDIGNMGVSAVKSHMKSDKHCDLIRQANDTKPATGKQPTLSSFSVQPSSSTTAGAESAVSPGIEANHQVSTSSVDSNMQLVTGSVQSFVTRDEVTKAEVLWTLKSVMSHQSYNSATGLNDLLMTMFPDSDIASKFRLGADKMAYIVKFGLAPYFYEELVSELKVAEHYVIAFDESMNRICQEEQMDMHVRFWDSSANRVANRYLGSSFLGHTAADDLVKGLKSNALRRGAKLKRDEIVRVDEVLAQLDSVK